ncbi:TPA: hypothetical protein EYP13_00270 [Candidatus Micrarchaeota archaeon]|nr:hypothetical protein [Candidatus Micrarchaeota archaeon]
MLLEALLARLEALFPGAPWDLWEDLLPTGPLRERLAFAFLSFLNCLPQGEEFEEDPFPRRTLAAWRLLEFIVLSLAGFTVDEVWEYFRGAEECFRDSILELWTCSHWFRGVIE